MNSTELNQLAQRVHKANEKWWQDPFTKQRIERNRGELLMLVVTELSEACEGERKNLMDDKLPHRKMSEVECADAYIRMLDFAAGFEIDLYWIEDNGSCPSNKGEALLAICFAIGLAHYRSAEDTTGFSGILAMIRCYCIKQGYDLMGAFEEKMTYNTTREDHKHEARQQADGKKW